MSHPLFTLSPAPVGHHSEQVVTNTRGVAVGTIRRLPRGRWGWRDRENCHSFPTEDAAALARLRYFSLRKLVASAKR